MEPPCGKITIPECGSQESVKEQKGSNSDLNKEKSVVYELALDDISTESDEALKEDNKQELADVTSGLIDLVKEHDTNSSSSSYNHNVDTSALEMNSLDGCENFTHELGENIGLGKSCSCSFCLKAAHMWMDLTIQDTRGRENELKKSKKRASDQIAKINYEFSRLSKSAKMEFDLMQNWKIIFSQTQDALAQQLSRTQSELQMRSKLMENCKRELESKSSVDADLDKPS